MDLELKMEAAEKPEYQVFEINGMKLDYFDFKYALFAVRESILNLEFHSMKHPEQDNRKMKGYLRTVEKKFEEILRKMDRPPENERPAGLGITIDYSD